MTAMIEIRNLVKQFGPLTAVDDISFTVDRGEVLGFLGPNGAGKSTTMKMITGFLTPTSGAIDVCGHAVANDPIAVKRRIGYLPEGAPAYPDMTPAAYLNFIAAVRGLSGADKAKRLDYAVQRIGLTGVMQQSIDTLSKGYKRRVGLAQAILHDPEVLILDEPTDGLDPNQKHEVRGLISEMAENKAIVISTHILEEVDAVCSRAMVIADGKLVADGTPAELEARSRFHNAVTLRLEDGAAATAADDLAKLAGVASVEPDGNGGLTLFPTDGAPILDAVGKLVRERGWPVNEIRVEGGRLDDVFRDITTGRAGKPDQGAAK
ncbi:MAG: ATP-binding cassette domain-containing protein [Minwuiales bacterium]|nr:ATP-binding cassette domain-containing protein [Minwuiales bacterium]